MKKILIVEDDRELNQGISYALKKDKYEIVCAYSLKEARSACFREEIDLILLDINLPDGEGFEFCSWVKERNAIPVVFLTARDLEEDVLKGYDIGASDYITKPFSIKVLLKKVHVLLDKGEQPSKSIFEDGFLTVDFDRAKVQVNGELCRTTPTELRMLRIFIENEGQVLTYSVLLEKLWDCEGKYVDKHTLAVNVNRLRGKIEDQDHKYISNIYGMGYQWLKKL